MPKPAKPDAPRTIAAAILAAMTILRLAVMCTAMPIIGYANNLDFFRQSACIGVWQDYGKQPKISAHMDGPVDRLVYDGQRIDRMCLRSSDNLFLWAVAHLHGKHSVFPLRAVGAAKALATALAMLVILAQPIPPAARLAMAAAFLLAFGDIANLAYFNTLYLDASAIVSATLLAALCVTIAARRTPPPVWLCAFGAILLFWLGCSKPQFMVLAVLLGGGLAWLTWRGWRLRARAGLLAAAGALAPLLFLTLNADPHGVFHGSSGGNMEDTVMATVLPAAPDKPRALRLLGLPAACMAGIGQTGFETQTTGRSACPQVDGLSRFRLLPLFAAEPATFFRPLWLAIGQSQTGIDVLPHAETAAAQGRVFTVLAWTSLSTWLAVLPPHLFGVLVAMLMAAGLACLPIWLTRQGAASGLAAAGGVLSLYAFGSAVFGDGFVEVARHEAIALSGLIFTAAGLATLIGQAAARRRKMRA